MRFERQQQALGFSSCERRIESMSKLKDLLFPDRSAEREVARLAKQGALLMPVLPETQQELKRARQQFPDRFAADALPDAIVLAALKHYNGSR